MHYSVSNCIFLIFVAFTFLSTEVFCCAPNPRANPRHTPGENYTPKENYKTYFNGQYLPIGSSGSCPRNMALFDGPNNQGFCDCLDLVQNPAFYSDKTGECFFHNTRGPCSDGEWFVLKNGYPVCEPVPEGCPADGNHFYGTPKETMAKRCFKLWEEGPPCLPYQHLQLREGPELKIVCDTLLSFAKLRLSAGMLSSCRLGTLRKRSGHCSGEPFYG